MRFLFDCRGDSVLTLAPRAPRAGPLNGEGKRATQVSPVQENRDAGVAATNPRAPHWASRANRRRDAFRGVGLGEEGVDGLVAEEELGGGGCFEGGGGLWGGDDAGCRGGGEGAGGDEFEVEADVGAVEV